MDNIRIGLIGERSATVTSSLSAVEMGSGSLEVYATPAMIALMEGAAVAALAPCLAKNQSSVGVAVEVQHVAATPLGQRVRARAEVIAIEGRQVIFKVQAWDEKELIGEGLHRRVVIDVDRFMTRVRGKVSG